MSRWKLDSDALPGQETCLSCGGLHYGTPKGVCPLAPGYVSPKPWPKESRVIMDRINDRHLCHICEERTELKCSDCAINLKAEVFVCENPKCRDEHENRYCSGPNRHCAGGEHCVCQPGYGHKKNMLLQTPISVPLAEKSKEELVRIVEMMQEDLQWYVAEGNRLLAAAPPPTGTPEQLREAERRLRDALDKAQYCARNVEFVFVNSDWINVCQKLDDIRRIAAAPQASQPTFRIEIDPSMPADEIHLHDLARGRQMRVLDLCAGELGWSAVFAQRGHICICVDLRKPARAVPQGCTMVEGDILEITADYIQNFNFVVASTPCEQFSTMLNFRPPVPFPALGIKLFNHARSICEAAGIPYVMENVAGAQRYVGKSDNHAGSFHLWGTAVPTGKLPNCRKGMTELAMGLREHKGKPGWDVRHNGVKGKTQTDIVATIPPELANCVAEYAERIVEQWGAQREAQEKK